MARDVMSVPVSTISSESCFSLAGRIIKERHRRLLPEHVEMLACIKDWEPGDKRLQHSVDNLELVESFEKLYLDEDGNGAGTAENGTIGEPGTRAAGAAGSRGAGARGGGAAG